MMSISRARSVGLALTLAFGFRLLASGQGKKKKRGRQGWRVEEGAGRGEYLNYKEKNISKGLVTSGEETDYRVPSTGRNPWIGLQQGNGVKFAEIHQ